jgi:hypothetical protein
MVRKFKVFLKILLKMKRKQGKELDVNGGITVILNDSIEPPHCPHGPTVLFQRHCSERAFFACSAFRDKKDCQFFVWRDDFEKNKDKVPLEVVVKTFKTYNEIVANDGAGYIFCHSCSELMESSSVAFKTHKGHDLRKSMRHFSKRNSSRFPANFLFCLQI